jgi:hypothetical protein
MRKFASVGRGIGTLVVWLAIGVRAIAAGPDLASLFPAGGQRGTTVEVTLSGELKQWPVQAWVDEPGLTVTAAEEKGKLSIVIAADAAPGPRWIRVYDSLGTSAPHPFIVSTLGEAIETEPNNAPGTAQVLDSPNIVVNGKLASRDVDMFSVPLVAGQALVASLTGHEGLASPMDAVMHIVSPAGFQLAYNHDGRGLDPEIVYTAPFDGTYLVRVFGFPSAPNSTIGFSGSDRHLYRLTLSTGGFVDYPWPLAVTRGQEASLALAGWNVPDSLSAVSIQAEVDSANVSDSALANVSAVRVEPHATLIEIEPSSPEAPQAIMPPVTLTGRIADREDVDVYAFDAKAGQSVELQIESRSLGYPLDSVLQITDAAGKSLARIDDSAGRDSSTVFAPPADGTFRVTVSDLNAHGSPRHVYRLRVVPAVPSFEVTADASAYTIALDKPAEITLAVDRRHGFAEEIALSVTGLPEFVTASAPISKAEGDSAKSVKLTLTSKGGSFSGPIRIEAKAAGVSQLACTAATAIPDHTARLSDLWLTVLPPKP